MLADQVEHAALLEVLDSSTASGALWAFETDDLDCSLVNWNSGEGVVDHVNAEVDVLIIVLQGDGALAIDGCQFALAPGFATLIPKGATRSIASGSGGLAYVSVHKRRKRLMPTDPATRIPQQANLLNPAKPAASP